MGLKRKPPTSLFDLLESQPGKGAQGTPQPSAPSPLPQPQTIQTRSSSTKSQPQSPRPKLPAPPQPALPPRPETIDSKRKMSPKGKETMDGGKSQPSKGREEAPRVKQLKIGHQSKGKETEAQSAQSKGKGVEAQSLPSAWLLAPMLHEGPLLEPASMRDLGDGEDGYVADALGRTMLLPTDVDELKKMRMQEVFLNTKRYLGMALQATYRMEEEVNKQSKAAENECSKRLEATRTLKASEDDLAKAKVALKEAIRDRDSASAENDKGVVEYAQDEAVRAKREAEFARNEAEAAKETAEDEGYNAGVWEETLKQAGVDASSDLWKAENIFYPTAIREAASTSSEAVSDQHEGWVTQSEAVQVGASPGEPLKGGELQDAIEAPERMDPEVPKEDVKPVVGVQIPDAEEPTILAQPLQAIPLTVVPKSTNTDPAQSSPEGTVLQGVKAGPVPPSQDVADTELKK
ncbi:uncharacterized protein LOC126696665 [Quercus robur]|uniref:uncharacterized protein LOC126696665 n=1 Tax=Quercus robur TaxID=38942 RepID=UPI0021628E68|nr:uncharacterized protein LOC126696665 [Quercus robur]